MNDEGPSIEDMNLTAAQIEELQNPRGMNPKRQEAKRIEDIAWTTWVDAWSTWNEAADKADPECNAKAVKIIRVVLEKAREKAQGNKIILIKALKKIAAKNAIETIITNQQQVKVGCSQCDELIQIARTVLTEIEREEKAG